MKLTLNKQKVTALSSKDMGQVNGGGLRRSRKNGGGCNYSRKEDHMLTKVDVDGNIVHIGCYK